MIGIYALVIDDKVAYIGQSVNIQKRYTQHCSLLQNNGKTKRQTTLFELLSKGTMPKLKIIELMDSSQELDAREKYWISYYRSRGLAKLNSADGGQSMGHLHRAKKSQPWGNHWSPLQKILNSFHDTIKTLEKIGKYDQAESVRAKLIAANDLVKLIGRDEVNRRLYLKEKHHG